MRILLVEPDPYYHQHFTNELGETAQLQICHDSAEALNMLQSFKPDAVVMELLLPDRSGYELLAQIRRQENFEHLPIVIFSQIDNLDDIQESLNFGITGYFVKGRDYLSDIKKLLLTLGNEPVS